MGKFDIFTGANGQWYFHLKAGNGEKILGSEGYAARAGAVNGVNSVKSNAPHAGQYESLSSKDGRFYFTLKAGNGEVIGTSEMYNSDSARDEGIRDVQRIAPTASLEG
jgi:uncharacterized protein YegP (UPF0339 family)